MAVVRPLSAAKSQESRYSFLKVSQDDPYDYADFLQMQERKCGPDGFLDSKRFTNSVEISQSPESSPRRSKTQTPSSRSRLPTSTDVALNKQKYEKQHERRLKLIEDGMWKAKQEERELKRFEGDILKNQGEVRRALRTYEQNIEKRRLQEDIKLNKGQEKYTELQRRHTHSKQTISKERTLEALNSRQDFYDSDHKYQMNTLGLARQYRAKEEELALRRHEADVLLREFQTRFRRKEEEQAAVQREMAELASAMSMEVARGRHRRFNYQRNTADRNEHDVQQDLAMEQHLEKQLATSGGAVKQADLAKRKLNMNLENKRSTVAIKKREDQRALQSTRNKLEDNAASQQAMHEDARYANLDKRQKELQHKLEEVNARRENQLTSSLSSRKSQRQQQENFFAERASRRRHESERRDLEDSLRHFQRASTKAEELEHELYSQVKAAEYERSQHEQTVRRLNQQLQAMRTENKDVYLKKLREGNEEEVQLEAELIRAKADLDKAHANREEAYYRLGSHRRLLSTEKYNMQEFSREHERRMNIGNRTDTT